MSQLDQYEQQLPQVGFLGANGKAMNVAGHFHCIGLRVGTISVFSYLGESKAKNGRDAAVCPRVGGVEESLRGKKR